MRYYPDELYHFGIKGMKWGVRRFQRKDGSYTKQGLARERNSPTKGDKAARKERIKKIAKGAAIAGLAVGGTYLAYKNRDKIGALIKGKEKKGNVFPSDTSEILKRVKPDIKAIDKVTHKTVKVDRVQPNRTQPDRYSTAFGNFSTRTPKAGTASRSKVVNKSLAKNLARDKKERTKANVQKSFDEFDKAMKDPGSIFFLGGPNNGQFRRSDGTTTKIGNAIAKYNVKKPKIKKSKVSRKRSSSRIGGGSGRSYSDPIHHRINIQRQREY